MTDPRVLVSEHAADRASAPKWVCHVPSACWRDVRAGLNTEGMTTATENMHATVAAFVAEHIATNPDQFNGGFSYRVDVHTMDGGIEPFIFTTDAAHTELWKVSTR